MFIYSSEGLLFYYLLCYDVKWKVNIFIPFHGGYQIKNLDVAAHEARLWS